MNRNEVFERVSEICKDVFDDEELIVNETTSIVDIDGWDSLTHLSLINEIEQAFDFGFTLDETMGSKSIAELINVIMNHIEGK